MDGLSAKVFRTFNASWTFQQQLNKLTPESGSVTDKFAAYTEANRQVAILCNHKRTVPKTHETGMAKIEDNVRALKYQKMRLRKQMIALEPSLKKKQPGLLDYESDIDDAWITQHQKDLVEKQREQIRKKFEKENEKRAKEDEKPLPESELKTRLEAADSLEAQFAEEARTGTVKYASNQTIEKCEKAIEKIDEKIYNLRSQREMKDLNKETALGTSKLNYIDPRMFHLELGLTQVYHTLGQRNMVFLLKDYFRRQCGKSLSGRLWSPTTGSFKRMLNIPIRG